MRKLASIQRIAEIKPIEGADAIDAYRINGWWVVDKKQAHAVGDQVIYCEPDSWIPTELAPFLSKDKAPRVYKGISGEKLRTVRLRGQLSQGLILPIPSNLIGLELDTDVSEALNVIKWEAPEDGSLGGDCKSTFPSFIPKTDQDRIQNSTRQLATLWAPDEWTWEVTEKLEGSSCTCFHYQGETGVCSRNFDLIDTPTNAFWMVAKKYNIIETLLAYGGNIAIQGELVGPKVCGNIYKLTEYDLYVYDIYDIDAGAYFLPADRIAMCEAFGLKHTPVIDVEFVMTQTTTVDDLLTMADGDSVLFPTKREGLVFKSTKYQTSFKAVSNEYLLATEKKRK